MSVEGKIVMNGELEIFEDGRIYAIKPNEKKLLKPHIMRYNRNGKIRQYFYVSYKMGEQHFTFSYARLLAEAFLPKEGQGKGYVTYKDGNTLNVALNNLEWYKGSQKRKQPRKEVSRIVSE